MLYGDIRILLICILWYLLVSPGIFAKNKFLQTMKLLERGSKLILQCLTLNLRLLFLYFQHTAMRSCLWQSFEHNALRDGVIHIKVSSTPWFYYKFSSGAKNPARLTDRLLDFITKPSPPSKKESHNGIKNWKWRIMWILYNIWVKIQVISYFLHQVLIKPESLFIGVKETIPLILFHFLKLLRKG